MPQKHPRALADSGDIIELLDEKLLTGDIAARLLSYIDDMHGPDVRLLITLLALGLAPLTSGSVTNKRLTVKSLSKFETRFGTAFEVTVHRSELGSVLDYFDPPQNWEFR